MVLILAASPKIPPPSASNERFSMRIRMCQSHSSIPKQCERKVKFSDRIGATSPPDVLQLDGMSIELRTSLWNVLLRTIFSSLRQADSLEVCQNSAEFFFKVPVDTLPAYEDDAQAWFRAKFYGDETEWWQVYNLLEFLARFCNHTAFPWIGQDEFIEEVNQALEREMSGYRFIGETLSPITNAEELNSIRQAIVAAGSQGFAGVQRHFTEATRLLSRRPNPDYRNSIKESISAVES
jgi:hypothetical protein